MSGPDWDFLEKASGIRIDPEDRPVFETAWRYFSPQYVRDLKCAENSGKLIVKNSIARMLESDFEKERSAAANAVRDWQWRGLRKTTFRVDALKQILARIENL